MSTTFSLSTSGLHGLLGPVLPHVGTDRDLPELTTIRIEVRDNTVYAVATDRFTFAATRHQLDEGEDVANTAVTIAGGDAHTLLRVFKHTRKDDPQLTLTVTAAGGSTLTVTAAGGSTLTLSGRGDGLAFWRAFLAKHLHREDGSATPSIGLDPSRLRRWIKAVEYAGQPLALSFGAGPKDPVVVRCGERFVGLWAPVVLTGDVERLQDSVWCKELPEVELGGAA